MEKPGNGVCTADPEVNKTLRRRGLFAAAVALFAGTFAKITEKPVYAGADGDVVLAGWNSSSADTVIENSAADDGNGFVGLHNAGTLGAGLAGWGSGWGVYGESTLLNGVAGVGGHAAGANTPGVFGTNQGAGPGVWGSSTSGYGVLGQITSSSTANTVAVYGLNFSSYKGGGPGAGGFGLYGLCKNGHGLVGATGTAGGAAVVGASNGIAGAYAAVFYGPVVVTGGFTVAGGPKSAAVPHPDGTHRRLYCLESPESWFEDFGTAALECGRVQVMLDPDFAALVDVSDYQVFLTERGSHQALSVVDQTPTGFVVEANAPLATLLGKGESDLNGAFNWRVVAKRKDIDAERLERVTLPGELKLPAVPDLKPPVQPRIPRR
jgi:hypothetical protein